MYQSFWVRLTLFHLILLLWPVPFSSLQHVGASLIGLDGLVPNDTLPTFSRGVDRSLEADGNDGSVDGLEGNPPPKKVYAWQKRQQQKRTSNPAVKTNGNVMTNLEKAHGASIPCASKKEVDLPLSFEGSGVPQSKAVKDIIVFIVDDLQPDAIRAFDVRNRPSSDRKAYQYIQTPTFDMLAKGGAIFTRAYTTHPLCSPSRYAIMTGRLASRSRRAVQENVDRSRSGNPPLSHITLNGNAWVVDKTRTLGHAMQDAGYVTGATGKWHMSSTVETSSFTYQDAVESDVPYEREVAEVKRAGFDEVFALYPINMRDQGFSWFSHDPEWSAVESMEFIDRAHARKKPYFLYFAFTLPHMPFSGVALRRDPGHVPDHQALHSMPRAKVQRMQAMRERMKKHVADGNAVAAHSARGAAWYGGNDKKHNVPGLLWIDGILKEFVAHLKQRDAFEKTLIIFSADHGCVGKGHCFEPGTRVPMLMHCPQLIPVGGRIVDGAVVANLDIPSTVLDAAGVGDRFLRGGDRIIDGRSLLPLVVPSHRHYDPSQIVHVNGLFCEIYSDRAIITENYTYVDKTRTHYKTTYHDRKPWGDRIQLFSSQDYEQRTNLAAAATPAALAVMQDLSSRLRSHIQLTVPKCQMEFRPADFPAKLTDPKK